MTVETVTVVRELDTRVWIESDLFGSRHVMVQHEGMPPFTYCSFHYDYAYTSNAHIHLAACNMARALGAEEPIVEMPRAMPVVIQPATTQQVAETCIWTEEDDQNMPGTWASSCGELWTFTDGGPVENDCRFCHGCGKAVHVVAAPQHQEGG